MRAAGRLGRFITSFMWFAALDSARADWIVEPFAGGGPNGLPVLEANLARPVSVARDAAGTLYVLADDFRVFRSDPSGRLEVLLDSDLHDPVSGTLHYATDLAVHVSGDLLVVHDQQLVRYNPSSGEIVTVNLAPLRPSAVASGPDGSVHILASSSDLDTRSQIYRVDLEDGTTERVVGAVCPYGTTSLNCIIGFFVDGTPALDAVLREPVDFAVAANGDIYIGTTRAVARFDAASGLVSWFAGLGGAGFGGDGGPARLARLSGPAYIAVGTAGDVWISDSGNNRIRRVDPLSGVIDTVVGEGTGGFGGDGGSALSARLYEPTGLTVGPDGGVWIADTLNHRIRALDPVTRTLSTVAGNGSPTFSGDGYPATSASISNTAVALDAEGNAYIPDTFNHRVRKVDRATGLISTYAGNGQDAPAADYDGVPALDVALPHPGVAAVSPTGDLFVNYADGRVGRIDARTGLIHTLPGEHGLRYLAFDPQGELHAFDLHQVFRIDLETGARELVAGNAEGEYNGEGVPALEAGFEALASMQFDEQGALYLGEYFGRRVRRVDPHSGLVYTVAGSGFASEAPARVMPALVASIDSRSLAVQGSTLFVIGPSGVGRVDLPTGRLEWGLGALQPPDPQAPIVPARFPRSIASDGADNVYVGVGRRVLLARDTNHAPVAVGGGDRSVSCTSREGARVALNGVASSDPDDAVNTDPEIVEYWWYEDRGHPSQRVIAKGEIVEVGLPIGRHEITLQVGDRWFARSTDTFTVEVRDEHDPDADGVGTCADNCPAVPNADQNDGDGNDVGDACDRCSGGPFDDLDGDAVCSDADNCPQAHNPAQLDADADTVGDACDVCPRTANPDQAERAACLAPRSTGECLGITADLAGAGRHGRFLLFEYQSKLPSAIYFEIYYQDCQETPPPAFYLNDVPLEGQMLGPGWCPPCPSDLFVVTDVELIRSAWRPRTANRFRVQMPPGRRVYLVRARLYAEDGEVQHVCLYSFAGEDCQGSCSDYGSGDGFDLTVEAPDPFFRVPEVLTLPFGGTAPPSRIAFDGFPDGDYRVCIAASHPVEPGKLLVAAGYGALFEADILTGEAAPLGILPMSALDIAHDPATGRSVLSTGASLFEFDSRDGVATAPPIPTERSYERLAFGPWGWVGADIRDFLSPPDPHSRTTLYRLNVAEGSSELMATWRNQPLQGIAYDDQDDVMRALVGSSLFGGLSILANLDPQTGLPVPVASTSQQLQSLVAGPDGLLYALHLFDGTLYRIDAETAHATPIGPLGVPGARALMRTGRQGSVDCVDFSKNGESILALNASCGAPSAVATSSSLIAECTSPEGGALTLDGSMSTDPNSAPGTNDGLAAFEWFLNYGFPEQRLLGTGPRVPVVFPLGRHQVTLRVTNLYGESATDEIQVEVVDTLPPSIEIVTSPRRLWPPDHRLVQVTARIRATDACGDPAVALLSLASSEPDDAPGAGDGTTTGDIREVEPGTADVRFLLRAERSTRGSGRRYVVIYSATDRGGNESVGEASVVVPHDLRRSAGL